MMSQYIGTAHGGDGFGTTNATYQFKTQIEALSSDSNVKYVIIGGGYNDITSTSENIATGMSDCKTLITSKFPNATMCVAFIGNTTDVSKAQAIVDAQTAWNNAATSLNVVNLQNTNVLTENDMFSSDGVHPNEKGQKAISAAVITAMNNQLLS